jgi:hypothetical protein
MSENPYESPQAVSQPHALEPRKPRALKTLATSLALAIGCGLLLLISGYFVGRIVYDWAPQYWNYRIYGPHFGPDEEEKVRIQTGLRFALNSGAIGFWGGLAIPWVRFQRSRFRTQSSKSPPVGDSQLS